MHTRSLSVLAVTVILAGTLVPLSFTMIPTAHAEEGGGGGGSEGGGGSSGGGGGSGGGHGAHRGHNMNVIYTVARFLVKHGNFPSGGFGGTGDTPMSSEEKQYFCSMHKYLNRLHSPAFPEIVAYIANLLNRPTDFVASALRNPQICQ